MVDVNGSVVSCIQSTPLFVHIFIKPRFFIPLCECDIRVVTSDYLSLFIT